MSAWTLFLHQDSEVSTTSRVNLAVFRFWEIETYSFEVLMRLTSMDTLCVQVEYNKPWDEPTHLNIIIFLPIFSALSLLSYLMQTQSPEQVCLCIVNSE